MARAHRKQPDRAFTRAPPGAPPGTLQAPRDAVATRLSLHAFGPERCDVAEGGPEALDALLAAGEAGGVRWLDVTGLSDVGAIEAIGRRFGVHPLALEDVVHVHQRAKVEAFDGHTFIVLRMVAPGGPRGVAEMEQISLFVGEGWLLTFQERPGDVFEPVRERLRAGRGRLRAAGADHLAYALLDSIVDAAFPVLERYDHALDELELRVLAGAADDVVSELHQLRADLLQLRRVLWPLREAMASLSRDETTVFRPETRVFLRDCHDHAVQLLDLVEAWRELGASLMDLHLSAVSQRTNETMRVLTVLSVVFMPLSFIAGVYGMNFDPSASPWNMPELRWAWGYPLALGLMATTAAALLGWFWRRGYLRRRVGVGR
jgi:magnesium transporter